MIRVLLAAALAEKGLPNGVALEEVERMRELGGWALRYTLASEDETRRLSMAPLVQELVQRMTDAARAKGGAHGLRGGGGAPVTPRFLLYSGHDTTVQPLAVRGAAAGVPHGRGGIEPRNPPPRCPGADEGGARDRWRCVRSAR